MKVEWLLQKHFLIFISVFKYYVLIHTGDVDDAETNAEVYLKIFGEKGDTGKRVLLNSNNSHKFRTGQVRNYPRLSVCPSIHLSVCVSVHPSFCLSISVSVHPSACQSVWSIKHWNYTMSFDLSWPFVLGGHLWGRGCFPWKAREVHCGTWWHRKWPGLVPGPYHDPRERRVQGGVHLPMWKVRSPRGPSQTGLSPP